MRSVPGTKQLMLMVTALLTVIALAYFALITMGQSLLFSALMLLLLAAFMAWLGNKIRDEWRGN